MIIDSMALMSLQTRIFSIEETALPILRAIEGNDMTAKLTPRQNELISEALMRIAIDIAPRPNASEVLHSIQCALVAECKLVTADTDLSPTSPDSPSIGG